MLFYKKQNLVPMFIAAPQTMLATRRWPPGVHAKLYKPCLVARVLEPCGSPSSALYSRRLRPALLVERCRVLSSAPSTGGSRESSSVRLWDAKGWGVRCLSGRAASVAHGSRTRTETPAIPSFIEIRELATLLRVKPKSLFKSLGGYQEKKRHRIVLSGVPYAFPKLGNTIVPFEDAHAVAKLLDKEIRFLDVDKTTDRANVGVPLNTRASSGEEHESGGHGRRPVVVLLGHFNHGKTTILDALLGPDSGIAEREAGGITQEIRARTVPLETSQREAGEGRPGTGDVPPSGSVTLATFLDTPGQEIFYRMRTNGARVADAVLLVVSAVDGVCLQTSESIGCAEELGLPAVVALNKTDLLPEKEAAQTLQDLSKEIREFVALENAQILPISAHTGRGLDDLRVALSSALRRQPHPSERRSSIDTVGLSAYEPLGPEESAARETGSSGIPDSEAGEAIGVAVAEAPEGAATASVLDYTSSAKTGKIMLVLVDKGVLRVGDFFVSGLLWGSVRTIYDEEGVNLLEHAGPGVAAKVVVVARVIVRNAPLGEPFRVLTKEAAEKVGESAKRKPKVALVRKLAGIIDSFVDHRRLEREFPDLLENAPLEEDSIPTYPDDGEHPEDEYIGTIDPADGGVNADETRDEPPLPNRRTFDRPRGRLDKAEELTQEDMPVTVVVKADSANTLASIMDALGDWGDVNTSEEITRNDSHKSEGEKGAGGRGGPRQEWGEGDLQHKQRRRLVVSVARSGVGAVTSSDVRLARDCECPVFAHNVRADTSAARELKRVGGEVVYALPEEAAFGEGIEGVGGREGFIGSAGEGRACVVVSETVGELLGEIERFVLRVR